MNPYKQAWMIHAGMIYPKQRNHVRAKKQGLPSNVKLGSAIGKTARAGAIAIALSQIDGPLPVADVLALTYFTTSATLTWMDYFFS